MCRLTAVMCAEDNPILLADILTRPCMSIIRQSFYAQQRLWHPEPRGAYEVSSLNGDGFGVGWYVPVWSRAHYERNGECPCVFTSLKPAWSDRNLVNISENVISPLLFAHVRAAGPGSGWSSEMNCHPYQYGRYLFMHNGTIGEWCRVRRRFLDLLSPAACDFVLSTGFTDSAGLFGLIISQLTRGPYGTYTLQELRLILERTVAVVEQFHAEENICECSYINMVFTDGTCITATRHVVPATQDPCVVTEAASLYFATGSAWGKPPGGNHYTMMHTAKRNRIAIVTSEPLTETAEEWVTVPPKSTLVVTPSLDVLIRPLPSTESTLTSMCSFIEGEHSHKKGSKFWMPALRCFSAYQKCATCSIGSVDPQCAPSLPPFLTYKIRDGDTAPSLLPRENIKTMKGSPCSKNCTTKEEKKITIARTTGSKQDDEFTVRTHTAPLTSLNPNSTYHATSTTLDVYMSPPAIAPTDEPDVLLKESNAPCVPCRGLIHGPTDKTALLSLTLVPNPENKVPEGKDGKLPLPFIYALAGGQNGTVSIWSLCSGRLLTTLQPTCRCDGAFLTTRYIQWTHRQPKDSGQGTVRHIIVCGSSNTMLYVWDISCLMSTTPKSTEAHLTFPLLQVSLKPQQGDILCLGVYPSCILDKELSGAFLYCGFQTTRIGCIPLKSLCEELHFSASEVRHIVLPVVQGLLEADKLQCTLIPYTGMFRHDGFVECLSVVPPYIISGGGDGLIHVWDQTHSHIQVLKGHRGGILCLAADGKDVLYSGSRDHSLRVWTLAATRTSCHHVLTGHTSDVVSCTVLPFYLCSGSTTSEVFVWCRLTYQRLYNLQVTPAKDVFFLSKVIRQGNAKEERCRFVCIAALDCYSSSWMEHLLSDTQDKLQHYSVLAACGDGHLRVWSLPIIQCSEITRFIISSTKQACLAPLTMESLHQVLSSLISFPSISGVPSYAHACASTATYLTECFKALNCDIRWSSPLENMNPVIVARLGHNPDVPTVLLYSHYDVVPATSFQHASHWVTDPWALTLLDDYYYGRGVTDNKGPLVAQIMAVAYSPQQQQQRTKNKQFPNIVFVAEGEEERGSFGFKEAVDEIMKTTTMLNDISCVLLTNSYWVGDTIPCIVAGMRGVMDATITVTCGSDPVGYHSGVHGGAISEPLMDVIRLAHGLVDTTGRVQIPRFYDDVMPEAYAYDAATLLEEPSLHSRENYKAITLCTGLRPGHPTDLLRKRWCEPVLSITEIWSSTQNEAELGETYRVIPACAHCNVSLRLVARQKPEDIAQQFRSYVHEQFAALGSPNKLTTRVATLSDWWIGDVCSPEFRAAKKAIETVWERPPLVVCEGGTMPVVQFLQDTFQGPVLHLPLGQASDAAHLPNERLRVKNLTNGIKVLRYFFDYITDMDAS